jgi:hypothetical protein
VKKILELKDKGSALDLKEKLEVLRNFEDGENIFLDYSAKRKGILTKTFKFKIYYRNESKPFLLSCNVQWFFLKISFARTRNRTSPG